MTYELKSIVVSMEDLLDPSIQSRYIGLGTPITCDWFIESVQKEMNEADLVFLDYGNQRYLIKQKFNFFINS